jgi:hypothetical protein
MYNIFSSKVGRESAQTTTTTTFSTTTTTIDNNTIGNADGNGCNENGSFLK